MNMFISGLMLTTAISFVSCGPKKSNSKAELSQEDQKKISEVASNLQAVNAELNSIKESLAKGASEGVKELGERLDRVSEAVKNIPEMDASAIASMKENMTALLQKIEAIESGDSGASEKVEELLSKLGEVEKSMTHQTAFHKACIASLNVGDSEKRLNVVNAMAFINTSKVARATEITERDFDRASKLRDENPSNGIVIRGTISEHRHGDDTFHAYTRLPSKRNYNDLSYRFYETSEDNRISALGATKANRFLVHDKDSSYISFDEFQLIDNKNPLDAINANKIESYSRIDCDRIATYMANVGSKALTLNDDRPVSKRNQNTNDAYKSHLRTQIGNASLVSDIISWLEERFETSEPSTVADSQRVMVIQDDLLRAKVDGQVDYSFLDLVDAPHLRFLAAVDSKIGQAKEVSDADFDNVVNDPGKHEALVSFVDRHYKKGDVRRSDKGFTELEAVFINVIPEEEIPMAPEVKKKAHNLFHSR